MKVPSLFYGLVLAAAPLSAVSIPVANFSFETPVLGTPGGFTSTVPSWVVGGAEATFQPAIPGQATAIPDGVQVLALGNGSAGTASQDTGVALAANTTYTLSLDILQRADFALSNYTIALFAGATPLASQNTPVVPGPGAFLADSLVYTSSALPPVGNLIIQLSATGNASSVAFIPGQADFDNVTLTAVGGGGAPEPSALVLGGLGLLPLFLLRRRRS
jgi:hapalindole biogenesis HpiC1 cyclase-like protein